MCHVYMPQKLACSAYSLQEKVWGGGLNGDTLKKGQTGQQ